MPYEKKWTHRQHTKSDKNIQEFGRAILAKIENSENGVFEGTFNEILEEANLVDDGKSYYGDLYNDFNEVIDRYNIKTKKIGRGGRRYWLSSEESENKDKDEVYIGKNIELIIKNIDIDNITDKECKEVLLFLQNLIKPKSAS